jgi:protein TonB
VRPTAAVAFDVAGQGKVTTAAPMEEAAPKAVMAAKAVKAERSEKRRPSRAAAAAAGETVAVAESAAVTESATVAESATVTESAAVAAAGSASVAAPAPGPASSAPDPVAIRAAIAGVVRYPRLARSQGLEGQVTVRFHIEPSGSASDLQIMASAGTLLDEAARDAVLRAAPYRSPPGWVRVPVIFSLHDAP